MTKKSIIAREKKREKLCIKYLKERNKLKKIIYSINVTKKEKWNAIIKLQKLPRDSSPSRKRNRCFETGRPRSFIRRFGLSRIKFREFASLGLIPGLTKSSW